MKRGDLVTASLRGNQGKPRPALILQAGQFDDLPTVTVLPLTSTLMQTPLLRVLVAPSLANGLAKPSHIMVDKPQSPAREQIGAVIGTLDAATMLSVNRALAVFLGLA